MSPMPTLFGVGGLVSLGKYALLSVLFVLALATPYLLNLKRLEAATAQLQAQETLITQQAQSIKALTTRLSTMQALNEARHSSSVVLEERISKIEQSSVATHKQLADIRKKDTQNESNQFMYGDMPSDFIGVLNSAEARLRASTPTPTQGSNPK